MKNIKSKFLSLLTAVFVLLPSIAVPVFASVSSSDLFLPDTADQYGNLTGGNVIGTNGSTSYYTAFSAAYKEAIGNVPYVAGYYYSGTNVLLRICVFGNVTSTSTIARVYQSTNGNTSSLATLTTGSGTLTLSDESALSVKFIGATQSAGYTMPNGMITNYTIFEDFDALKEAFVEYYENGFAPSNTYSYELQPGHVLYIPYNGSVDLDLDTRMNVKSAVIFGPWAESNQLYSIQSSLPSDSTVFPLSGMTKISWQKDPFAPDIGFGGRTRYAIASLQTTVSNAYFVIYNPLYWNTYFFTDENYTTEKANGSIHVKGIPESSVIGIKDYNISQRAGTVDGEVSIYGYVTNDSDPYDSVGVDTDGNIITQNSSGASPEYGGSTQVPEGSTAETLFDQLDNFVDRIVSLLTAPVSHIQRLVNAGSAFMNSLSRLYSWLPSDVSSVVISALVLVAVIGVFKVLL